MNRKYLNQTKGITLIALVITIIVLLILAGISISMLMGENGLLTKASDAKEETRGGEVKEYVSLAAQSNYTIQYGGGERITKAMAINDLYSKGKITAEEKSQVEAGNVITIGKNIIDFSVLDYVEPRYFYVYHGVDCMIERIPLTPENMQGYDITTNVRNNYFYGGYFSEYGGRSADVTTLTYTNNRAFDSEGRAYDGSELYFRKDGVPTLYWNKNYAYTESGKSIIPEENKVYYLHETPNSYLNFIAIIEFNNTNSRLTDVHLCSLYDCTVYGNLYYIIEGKENVEAIMYSGYTISTDNESTTYDYNMFDNVLGGSVLIGDLDFLKDGEYIKPDQQFTATPCVETKDGEVIRGRTRTFATGNDGNGYSTTATFHAVD